MFQYKYRVPKMEYKTTYGSICIENIAFELDEIERILPSIVLEDENIKHMFAISDLTTRKKWNAYRRFIPKEDIITDIDTFVDENMHKNNSFYSFLAEGILGLIFRDIYNYHLAKGVLDADTLVDSHTGVDACMYNLEHNIIVLGEAKFYRNLSEGISAIINDFVHKNIKNKLESLQVKTESCEAAYRIVIKNLEVDEYKELTIEQFMNQKIMFAGFVLHSEKDISKYGNQDFYDNFFISTQQLETNICDSLNYKDIKGDYEIILVHLPVSDKKKLIVKMIEASKAKIRSIWE